MSTKDLIERLTQTRARATRPSANGTSGEREEVQTRVGAGVIRRRRVTESEKPEVPEAAAPRHTVRPRPAEPVEVEAPVTIASIEEIEVAPEPVATVELPEPVEAPVEAREVVQVAPAVEPVEAPVQVAAAVPEFEHRAEAPREVVAVAVVTARIEESRVEQGSESSAAAAAIVSELPRADGSKPGALRRGRGKQERAFPGLGSAVVRPPPGYDPDDPMGNRRRAQAAAAAAASESQQQKVWRDGKKAAPAPVVPAPRERELREADRSLKAPGRRRAPRRGRIDMYIDDLSTTKRRRRSRAKGVSKTQSPQAKAIKRRVEIDGTITVSNLAHGMSVKSGQLIKALLGMGQMATANDVLDFETAQLVAQEFEFEIVNSAFQEDEHLIQFEDDDEDLESRPPVVTIMGHVDHGKTTLLDTIRKTKVASGEAGGITQAVSAYQVKRAGHLITFIDTPGHAAFTAMRARGAQVTDIVVLVVAADDGVMPQTVEVINHAKAAGVQILVAVNKIDKSNANPERVKQQLMEHGLVPEAYGGETIFCNVSALKGEGLDELLDNILVLAEVGEYKANPNRHGEGTVLEARLERGMGPVATVLVQAGSVSQGDSIVVGNTWGRVRAMSDFVGKRIKKASPSMPIEIMGLQDVPAAGDNFVVVENDKDAKALSEHRAEAERQREFGSTQRVTLEDILSRGAAGETIQLNLIIKADVGGSVEAIRGAFAQIRVPGTELKILHAGVGAVSESDTTLAHTYGAVIIAFNVRPDAKARQAADEYGVEIRPYKVIYEAIEDVEKALKGKLAPTLVEKMQGAAEIRQTFQVPKIGTVAGCMVTEGKIGRNHHARLVRDGKIVWEGRLASLRRFKDDVREVEKGYECGMNLDGFNDLKLGDVVETYTREAVEQV